MRGFVIIFFYLVFCMLSACAQETGKIYVQRDMSSFIKDAKITHDKIDIGEPKDIFDGDLTTLIRSESINPFSITLVLKSPLEFDRIRLKLTHDRHEWTMEIADNETDLNSKSESYKKIADKRKFSTSSDYLVLDKPIKASAFRLTIKRITGDDFVHLYEWEFPVEQKIKDMEILVLNYAPRDTNYVQAKKVFTNTILTLSALAMPETGAKIDVTREVVWNVAEAEKWMEQPNRYFVTKTGTCVISAEYCGLKKTYEVSVIEPMDYKNDKPSIPFMNNKTDLDVLFIERLPRIDYDGPNGGYPEEGLNVVWRAHVRNWGTKKLENVSYKFMMNGQVVKKGVIENFEPSTVANFDWEWKWHKSRNRIAFEIDPAQEFEEFSENNNFVEDYTDALAVGFYVEDYLWRVLHEYQPKLHIGSNGFEDWAQRQMREWNKLHANAVFLSTPQGVIDRVRLDRIIVVPNNALPMAGGLATNNPDNRDKTADLIWGFESSDAYNNQGWRGTSPNGHEYFSSGHVHELNHARYIIDSYGFDIHPNQVKILLDDGTPLAGSKYFPEGVLRYNKYRGIMGGPPIYDEYVALAWNYIAGKRARGGNYNAPTVIGEYLQLHPEKNTFTFTDEKGNPLAGAEIWIYRSIGTGTGWYDKNYDNKVDYKTTLDEKGQTDLPWTIFSEEGRIIHTYGNANSKVIVRINYQGKVGFEFIECSDFNMEYMRGNIEHGHYIIKVLNLK